MHINLSMWEFACNGEKFLMPVGFSRNQALKWSSVCTMLSLGFNTCGGRGKKENWQKKNLSYNAGHLHCFGQPPRTSELFHIGPKWQDLYISSLHQPWKWLLWEWHDFGWGGRSRDRSFLEGYLDDISPCPPLYMNDINL